MSKYLNETIVLYSADTVELLIYEQSDLGSLSTLFVQPLLSQYI